MLLEYLIGVLGSQPVKFHRYQSGVTSRLVEIRCETQEEEKFFNEAQTYLVAQFKTAGIKAFADNKTVFECSIHGKSFYVGFYDWVFSVGLDYWDEHEVPEGRS